MLKSADYFGDKIFTHYDVPDLPPTNNDLELVFGRARRHERLITGHKSTARRTARDGPALIPALEQARRRLPVAEDLAAVPDRQRRENLRAILDDRARFDRPRKLRKTLGQRLSELKASCRSLSPPSRRGPRRPRILRR